MDNLPFLSNVSLAESLKQKYLKQALFWIGDFKNTQSKDLLCVKTGNFWGIGYGIICFIKSYKLFNFTSDFPENYNQKVENAIKYLITNAIEDDNKCNWDNNIWDTSVICRTFLYYINEYPNSDEIEKIIPICDRAIKWLCDIVEKRKSFRYSIGIPDVAQMIRTFVFADRLLAYESKICKKIMVGNSSFDHVLGMLINEIVQSAERIEQTIDGRNEKIVVWDDDEFATADAIICISRYIEFQKEKNPKGDFHEIIDLLQKAIRYLEIKQIDGRWGIEETTSIGLQAYLLGSKVLGEDHVPEPHIVFKAIRYLCDPKTFFDDGSIAHKMEPTTYMVLALIEILESWELPGNLLYEKNTYELYDYVVWHTPTRATHEREKRYQIQAEAQMLKMELKNKDRNLDKRRREINGWRTFAYLSFWFICGYSLSVRFGFVLPLQTLNSIFKLSIIKWDLLIPFVTFWGGLGWFIYERIFKWNIFHRD